MDANNHPQGNKEQKEAPQPSKAAGSAKGSRRMFSKRWVYPAIYLGAAAIIIGLMYVKSQTGSSPVTSNAVDTSAQGQTTTTATAPAEQFAWPVATSANPKVTLGFFSAKASPSNQAAALVYYDKGYYAHQGDDIQAANKQAFNVEAALSGKVTAVTKDPVLGYVVEITSTGGYVERYESLAANPKVQVGDSVKSGQVIGTSGTSAMEKSQGNHVYFEIDKNGMAIDPLSVLPKQ